LGTGSNISQRTIQRRGTASSSSGQSGGVGKHGTKEKTMKKAIAITCVFVDTHKVYVQTGG